MVFSSTVFLFLFLPITLLLYFNPLCKSRAYKNIVLLLASLGFYAWGEPFFVFVMTANIALDWFMALQIEKAGKEKKKKYMILAVVIHLFILFLYKYLTFVCANLNLFMKKEFFTVSIALPIGISFFSFQMISYILDVYYGKARAQRNVLNVALYVSMFPQLVAGPIVRYETVAEEIDARQENTDEFVRGVTRFVVGLAKKVLLANYFGVIADNIFMLAEAGDVSAALAWLGAIAYTFQIYFDFSAYSDMAIGLGLIFGFHFNENFNYPYIAASVTDFWRRWHISLSTWFRDYVYIPLGGNRVGPKRHILNIFVVWLLTGIWHGANWTFILWGLLYFVFLILEKKTSFVSKIGIFGHVYTLLVVVIAWVIFRSDSMTQAMHYLGVMFGIRANGAVDDIFWEYLNQAKWLFAVGFFAAVPTCAKLKKLLHEKRYLYEYGKAAGILVLILVTITVMVKSTYNPFIYFNF